jgi:MFS family permease
VARSEPATVNRISPLRFIAGFGLVSAFADLVYEGARSLIGPYLGSLGATAAVVGVITGAGEAAALVLRIVTGRLADRTGRPWPQTALGYALTAICVPLVALTGNLVAAGLLYNGERVGKAVRTPARDTMLAHAAAEVGTGRAFGLHKALDQLGATAGPLLLAAVLALGGSYRLAFGLLLVPGAFALFTLGRLRRQAPDPSEWEPAARLAENKQLRLDRRLPPRFWGYAGFTAVTMLGFSTWGLLSFHLSTHHLVDAAVVPVYYAAAMAAASIAAVVFGRLYDRIGLRGLLVLPGLAAAVPFLSFSTSWLLCLLGALLWGAAVGIQDSTMRAAVTNLVPAHRRGAGFGTFGAVYGSAWLIGAALIGLLYDVSIDLTIAVTAGIQVLAFVAFVPLLKRTNGGA